MKCKKVRDIIEGGYIVEGAGVKLKLIFGFGNTSLTDHFLLYNFH